MRDAFYEENKSTLVQKSMTGIDLKVMANKYAPQGTM
jgi:hypothetical protein